MVTFPTKSKSSCRPLAHQNLDDSGFGGVCIYVDKHKPPTNHVLVACQDVEGRGHVPLDFHAFIEASKKKLTSANHQKIEDQLQEKEEVITLWRRLVSGPKFEKLRVSSWHIRTLPHQIPSTSGRVCPYSHQNLVGSWPTWTQTLTHFSLDWYKMVSNSKSKLLPLPRMFWRSYS